MTSRATSIVNEPGYSIVENASLEGRNTFRVPARAELLLDVHDAAALPTIASFAALKSSPPFVLGGGSNILFTRDVPGVLLALSTTGIRVVESSDEGSLVRVEAGENWNDVVHWSLAQGFRGLENLVLIPGTTGAAPIQNIGAYGVEVREFVRTVEVFEWRTASVRRLSAEECAFAYRDSIFKRSPSTFIVTAVEFFLPRQRDLRLDYAGIREELASMNVKDPTPITVAEAVSRLRLRKLPNPALVGNAGSFFKNPIVPTNAANDLRRDHPNMPSWPAHHDHTKLSAAWLIEKCGLKGFHEGDAGVSERHALVLVNHGKATGAQIWALAQRVREKVEATLGVRLEPEPVIL